MLNVSISGVGRDMKVFFGNVYYVSFFFRNIYLKLKYIYINIQFYIYFFYFYIPFLLSKKYKNGEQKVCPSLPSVGMTQETVCPKYDIAIS